MRNTDAELFKDKIEVSLDGRQIFYLFFGGAVIASLVFVLGVMVGKRLESRTHLAQNAETSAAMDPLAALDKLGSEERAQQLEFPTALMEKPAKRPSPENKVEANKAEAVKAKKAVKAQVVKAPKVVEVEEPPTPALKPAPAPAPKPASKSARAKFTLQLSSFQDRNEAEAFHAELTSSGYQPYIREANVPGKGLWFRVRLGRYVSHKDALAAKSDFEKRQKIIAYVTRLK